MDTPGNPYGRRPGGGISLPDYRPTASIKNRNAYFGGMEPLPLRAMEIDPHLYYPPDVDRPPVQTWPEEGISIDPRAMLAARGIDVDADDD